MMHIDAIEVAFNQASQGLRVVWISGDFQSRKAHFESAVQVIGDRATRVRRANGEEKITIGTGEILFFSVRTTGRCRGMLFDALIAPPQFLQGKWGEESLLETLAGLRQDKIFSLFGAWAL